MKKLKTLLSAALLLVTAFTQAQDESLLWKISGNGLSEASYLFGTIHAMCPDELELSPRVKAALAESKHLVLELDMDDPSFMQEMQKLSVNEGMKNLSTFLSEEDLKTLNDFFQKEYQANLSQLGILKPFVLLSMMLNKGLDCPQPAAFETELMAHAKAQNWEVSGLEELQDQFGVFDEIGEEEQLKWLLEYADNPKMLKKEMAKIVKAYQNEAVNEVLELMTESPEYKDFADALLFERNERWIAKIEAQAKEKPSFFAVGAAHLPSDRGVVELLRKQGYELTPILEAEVQ